jgi:quercetin dioxygenase-like cupin family protein
MQEKKMEDNKEKESKENLASQVINLADFADYQEDSVVSRAIIDKNAGTVTFFAFDEGQGLSEHTTPYEAMIYLVEGEAGIVVADEPYHLKAGQMIIMPANQPHAVKAIKKFKMILTMVKS